MKLSHVEIPKNETVPKSDRVSIATRLSPIKMAGLAVGIIILKNLVLLTN